VIVHLQLFGKESLQQLLHVGDSTEINYDFLEISMLLIDILINGRNLRKQFRKKSPDRDKTWEVFSLNNNLTAEENNLCELNYFHSLSLSIARKI